MRLLVAYNDRVIWMIDLPASPGVRLEGGELKRPLWFLLLLLTLLMLVLAVSVVGCGGFSYG